MHIQIRHEKLDQRSLTVSEIFKLLKNVNSFRKNWKRQIRMSSEIYFGQLLDHELDFH